MDGVIVRYLAGLTTLLLCLVVGVSCTFFPYVLQEIMAGKRRHWLSVLEPTPNQIRKYIESPWYIWHLRFCGVVALAGVAIVSFALVRLTIHQLSG